MKQWEWGNPLEPALQLRGVQAWRSPWLAVWSLVMEGEAAWLYK